MRLAAVIAIFVGLATPTWSQQQRVPNKHEQLILKNATAQRINIARANFTFLKFPASWKTGTFSYSFGIWPKKDRSRFDCVEAIVEFKSGLMVAVEEVSFDEGKSCEGARPK